MPKAYFQLKLYYLNLKSDHSMKNLSSVFCLVFALAMFTNLFTSCKKDKDQPKPEVIETPTENTNEPTTEEVTTSNVVTMFAIVKNDEIETDSVNLCDCFDAFESIDWEAPEAEINNQLEAIFSTMTDSEIEALFTPVCTPEGEFYINACVAACNGVTTYGSCEFYDGDELEDWSDCFAFTYPMTVVFPNNITTSVNSDDELIDVVEDWYDNNPDSNEDPTLAYPVEVTLIDGTVGMVNSDDEMDDLFDFCEEEEEECFEFIFPMTIQFPDSTLVEINSLDEGEDIVDAWFDANPDVTEDVTVIFPIQIKLLDGTIVDVNSEDEIEDIIEEHCDGEFEGWCFVEETEATLSVLMEKKQKTN